MGVRIKQLNKFTGTRMHRRSEQLPRDLVFLLALWPLFIEMLSDLPGLLKYSKYLADSILVLMLVLSLRQSKIRFRRCVLPCIIVIMVFFIYTLVVYLFRFQSIFFFLWGFRNNFRFYFAFLAYISMMDELDGIKWLKIIDVVFWLNVVLTIFQFSALGIRQDYLGGIFGVGGGTNGYTIFLLSIVSCKSVLSTFNGTETTFQCAMECAGSMLVAAMAEIKFFYFLFVFVLVVSAVITRSSWRKFSMMIVCTLFVFAGAMILVFWFEDSANFLSLESVWERATKKNYSSDRDLNRLSAIPILSQTIMENSADQLFGLGLGNCDTSAFSICNTPFYRRYNYLHYLYFSAPTIYLETGFVGLTLYFCFFLTCMAFAYRRMRSGSGNLLFNQLALIIAPICMMLAFYNASLRNESGYMAFVALALPYLQQKNKKQEIVLNAAK
jgi:hypothetical protein